MAHELKTARHWMNALELSARLKNISLRFSRHMMVSIRAMRARISQWSFDFRALLVNAGSIVGAQGVTSMFGFFYWWLAARQFPPEVVGFSSAAVSAMLLLGNMGMLGLGTLLVGELPLQSGRRASLVSGAISVAAVAGGVLGLVFAYAAPWVAGNLSGLSASPLDALLFATGVAASSAVFVLDQAVIGLLRGSLQLWRNTVFAVTKLVLLLGLALWVADNSGLGIYATWLCGNLISAAMLVGYAMWSGIDIGDLVPRWQWLRGIGRAALSHHALNVTLQAPSLLLPVLVTALISAKMNAYFYAAWMLAGFVYVGPTALATVLFAFGAGDRTLLAKRTRGSLALSATIALVANICLIFGADFILRLFGPAYSEQAGWGLRLLGLVTFPLIVRGHAITLYRLNDKIRQATVMSLFGSALELLCAASGILIGGLSGLCLGWLVAICMEGVLYAPIVIRSATLRMPES